MKKREHILCVSSDYLNTLVSPIGFIPTADIPCNMSDLFRHTAITFYPRTQAELDPRLRQIIPYIVLLNNSNKVLMFHRNISAGESRLHNKRSVGIGGHINTKSIRHIDSSDSIDIMSTIMAGLKKELGEELPHNPGLQKIVGSLYQRDVTGAGNHLGNAVFKGIIHSNETETDEVHIGMVVLIKLKTLQVTLPDKIEDDGLERFKFVSIEELSEASNRLESWSQFVLNRILRPMNKRTRSSL